MKVAKAKHKWNWLRDREEEVTRWLLGWDRWTLIKKQCKGSRLWRICMSSIQSRREDRSIWSLGGWRRIKSLLQNSSFSQCQSGAGDNMSVCGMTCAFVTLKAFKHGRHFLFRQIIWSHKKYFGKLLIEREIMYACINHDLTLRTSTSNNRFLFLLLWRWTANNNNDSSGNNKDVGNSCLWRSCPTKVLILNANDKHAVGFRSGVSLDDLWALTTLTNITAGHPFALEDSDENIFLVLG